MTETAQIIAWCIGIQTALTALVGGILGWSIKLRKAKSEIRIAERGQEEETEREAYAEAKEAFLILIEDFRDRIKSLEIARENDAKLREKDAEALQRCHREHSESRIEVEILKGRLLANDKAMELVEFKLSRLWEHDENNKAWKKELKAELDAKEQAIAANRTAISEALDKVDKSGPVGQQLEKE